MNPPILLRSVLSPDECARLRLLPAVERQHDDDDGHHHHGKPHRVEWLAERLNARVSFGRVDPAVKVYRIVPGEGVARHCDDDYESDGLTARWSCLVYLSEGHTGGETRFLAVPAYEHGQAGDALLFPHDLEHEATPVETGVRYVLKTDVLML